MAGILKALEDFGRTTGDYWSKDNAEFEATNPGLGDRLVRTFNPMTGLGSALGAMYDAASQGSARDAGIAALQSIPLFGTAAISGPAKAAVAATPDIGAWGAKALIGGLASAMTDQVQAGPPASRPDYGNRPDGTKKGNGFLGPIPLKGGGVATEYSIQMDDVTRDGKPVDFPTLVPTLTKDEVHQMVNDIIPNKKRIPNAILNKAISHAQGRIKAGKSPFADDGE